MLIATARKGAAEGCSTCVEVRMSDMGTAFFCGFSWVSFTASLELIKEMRQLLYEPVVTGDGVSCWHSITALVQPIGRKRDI